MSVELFFQHYKEKGFNFNTKILSRYCLSLYTKPFVILSGISGTGKTKIAQLFENFVDEEIKTEAEITKPKLDYVILTLTHGVLMEDGRGNLRFSDLENLFDPTELPEIYQKIEELKKKGVSDNIIEPKLFTIESSYGEFKVGIYLQRASSPLLRLRFKSRRGDTEAYNSQEFLKNHFEEGDVLALKKIGENRLKIVSVNDKEVSEIEDILNKNESILIKNKLFVSVKSNWTDNTELFGYFNILEEKYNVTPILKFMLLAKEYPTKPFFLILDEMNLSKVEHYFSDYLSCLESRISFNGEVHQEMIRLHNYGSYADSNDVYYDLIPNSIEVPLNLYITGTVNIDETTYAFSPKVLDRANVIEFNEVSLSSYQEGIQNPRFTLTRFPKFENALIANAQAYNNSPDQYKRCIEKLLNILQPYNLHFGYRAINEMALFVNHAREYVGDSPEIINDAIDIQISQKVLPKFSGAFGKLDEPLRKLIHYLHGEKVDINSINIDFTTTINPAETDFPESITKLSRMYNNLIYNGFTSFLE